MLDRRTFLGLSAGALFQPKRRHVILIVNGGGGRKKDYYENASLAPNVRRIAREGFVFEENHCESVASHDAAFAELVDGLAYRYTAFIEDIPRVMEEARPGVLVCRERSYDVGHGSYDDYIQAIRRTDARIGTVFAWLSQHPDFFGNTTLLIRPEFGRDDEINMFGQLHHSYGYYYTHRVASILWGPGIAPGVDRKTVVTGQDMPKVISSLLEQRPGEASFPLTPRP